MKEPSALKAGLLKVETVIVNSWGEEGHSGGGGDWRKVRGLSVGG